MTVPVLFARRNPLLAATALALGAVVNWLLIGHLVRCGAALPAVFFVAFAIGLRCRRRQAIVGMALLAVNIVCQGYSDPALAQESSPRQRQGLRDPCAHAAHFDRVHGGRFAAAPTKCSCRQLACPDRGAAVAARAQRRAGGGGRPCQRCRRVRFVPARAGQPHRGHGQVGPGEVGVAARPGQGSLYTASRTQGEPPWCTCATWSATCETTRQRSHSRCFPSWTGSWAALRGPTPV